MIKPGEIQQKARTIGVRDQQIEKDYILSWILFGIAKHEQLSNTIVFKGGTVLKKVYFEDYRFSEDLDFTLVYNETTNEQIFEWLMTIFDFIKEEANIPLEISNKNEHEDGGINTHNVLMHLHHGFPPVLPQIVFEFCAILSVIVYST
jgi:predicted nucleotidyltransferase component of viral defense system